MRLDFSPDNGKEPSTSGFQQEWPVRFAFYADWCGKCVMDGFEGDKPEAVRPVRRWWQSTKRDRVEGNRIKETGQAQGAF